ncbi:MAG: hypothetical protein A2138_13750 [Deltaproteobacteria bacterium RBG_16_71_12]|nr:MAG: hypothetical protein A2138_13750 [Deltaproteobacteria bacterium RBG_16_71_12]
MRRRSRSPAALLTVALALGGCATPGGDQPDCGEICSLMVFGVLAIPCGVAAGVGCIGGGITRCGEGAPPSEPAPEPAPAEALPAGAATRAMEY